MKEIDLEKLFNIAGKDAPALEKELNGFYKLLYQNFELRLFFENSAFSKESKKKMFASLFPGASKLFRDLVSLLIDNELENKIMKTSLKFTRLISKKLGVEFAQVKSAFPLSGPELKKIEQFIGENISVRAEVDPGLIGGLKITVSDGRYFDGSLQGGLAKLKGEMVSV